MMHHINFNSGFALIASLVILVTLTLIAVVGLRSSLVEEMTSGNQKQAASALFAAERGISQALEGLLAGTINDTGNEDKPLWSTGASVTGTGYTSTFTVSHLLTGGSTVEDDDGRRYFLINSTGATTTGDARRKLEVAIALEWGGSSNVAGLIGCQGVSVHSNVMTSSYSSSGHPGPGTPNRGDIATTEAEAFLYLDSNAYIQGEARSTGAIFMDSNAVVLRDALANLRIHVKSSNATIGGAAWTNGSFMGYRSRVISKLIYEGPSVVPNPVVANEPPCDPLGIEGIITAARSIRTSNNNGTDTPAAGQPITVNSTRSLGDAGENRDYWFSNFTFKCSDPCILTIQGNVRLYLTGNFEMDSDPQIVLGTGASLKIYMDPSIYVDPTNPNANDDANGRFIMKSNSEANVEGYPINLQVYSKAVDTIKDNKDWTKDEFDGWDDGDQKVYLDSNAIFYGMIYAPYAHAWLGSNVQIFGSVRGRFVDVLSNNVFKYDEDLDVLYTGNPTDYKMVYWAEDYTMD